MRIRHTRDRSRRAIVAALAAAALVAAAACTENVTESVAPSVAVQPVSGMVSLGAGKTVTVDVVVTRVAGFTGDVALAVGGAPAGLVARFEPAALPAGAASARLVLVLQAGEGLKPGDYTFDVRASAAGGVGQVAPMSLIVTPTFP